MFITYSLKIENGGQPLLVHTTCQAYEDLCVQYCQEPLWLLVLFMPQLREVVRISNFFRLQVFRHSRVIRKLKYVKWYGNLSHRGKKYLDPVHLVDVSMLCHEVLHKMPRTYC